MDTALPLPAPALTAGRPPETPAGLLDRLAALGIAARTTEHPPQHTVAGGEALRASLPGAHSKNLFLKLRRPDPAPYLLLVLEQDRQVSVNALCRLLGAGRGQFAAPEELFAELGVWPGSVTPFGLVNALPGRVRVAIDRALLEGVELVYFHPLANTATTGLAPEDLLRFLRELGHAVEIFDPEAAG
ncbi:prolyl-tRNA synthetase associated domain-containing protein [Teichococcus oryzae]|uniref:Prolyl-tRNA synthetase associated domain-containing protein n=1 Tax=Teichococcus oryzae TaxID=1608942 RepID=A0A5B2T9Y8_9PROT|nr:prolyl-tRNA synthetase associated domain-containing protein [Pseudoroseomonas oryzae]KAA2211437.1 prolyl-tRNA synthetase associated domain-containing protein [Pseudoroseomonas oryzae]